MKVRRNLICCDCMLYSGMMVNVLAFQVRKEMSCPDNEQLATYAWEYVHVLYSLV